MLAEHIEDVVYYLFYYGACLEVQVQPVDIAIDIDRERERETQSFVSHEWLLMLRCR